MLLHTHDGNAVTTANPLPVQLTGAEALVFAPVASATVGTIIDPLGVIAADATRKTLDLYNAGTETMYFACATTTNLAVGVCAFPLAAGASLRLTNDPRIQQMLAAVASVAGQTLTYQEGA